jgi:hypothetical protein
VSEAYKTLLRFPYDRARLSGSFSCAPGGVPIRTRWRNVLMSLEVGRSKSCRLSQVTKSLALLGFSIQNPQNSTSSLDSFSNLQKIQSTSFSQEKPSSWNSFDQQETDLNRRPFSSHTVTSPTRPLLWNVTTVIESAVQPIDECSLLVYLSS